MLGRRMGDLVVGFSLVAGAKQPVIMSALCRKAPLVAEIFMLKRACCFSLLLEEKQLTFCDYDLTIKADV